MMINYWNPIEEIDTVRRQLDHVFDSVIDTEKSSKYPNWAPAMELWDTGDALILKAFLPGVKAENLDIQATRESISISGVRHPDEMKEETKRLFSDISYGHFRRASKLPVAIQNTKVEASFDQGILTLKLPKVEREQNKVVKVNLLNGETAQAKIEASEDTKHN